MDVTQIAIATFTGLTVVGTAWNAYNHNVVMRIIAEMRYNMMREMNGRYTRLESFSDLKDRVKRLEEDKDAG